MDGEITERQFTPERVADAKLIAFVQKVEVHRHAELSAAYPGAVGNILTLRLRNGRTLTERVDYPHGHARNPLTDAEVEGKAHALADPKIGSDRVSKICGAVWKLDQARSVKDLFPLLQVP